MKIVAATASMLTCIAAAIAVADATPPDTKAAEKAARVRELTKTFRNGFANVRFKLKTLPDGTKPNISSNYRCPGCGSQNMHVSSDFIEKNIPCLVEGFVIAENKVLVQDLHLRPQWVAGIEVVSADGSVVPASPCLMYPDEEAILLETKAPLHGAKPIVFDGNATNGPSLFHFVEDFDGRTQAGLRDVNYSFRHQPSGDADWCSATPNTLVVDSSNRAVSVQMKLDRRLEDVVPENPSKWRSEPADARETRTAALEKTLATSFLPVYLHIDEEKKRETFGRIIYSFGHRDSSELAGDVDAVGLALPDGEVLIPLNLGSGKVAALDKMEATLQDGKKVSLEFVGAFSEYGMFLLRFADGRTPEGVTPAKFSVASAESVFGRTAYSATPKNLNGHTRLTLAPRTIRGFRRVRDGAVAPSAASDDEGAFLVLDSGEILAIGSHARIGGERWNSRTAVPGAVLAKLVASRAFDPEFAVRKGKARIRVAWIGVETQPMTKELAREKNAQGFLSDEIGSGSLVSKVYAGTPAAKAGVKEGDVLLWVRKATGERRERLETRDTGGFAMDTSDLFDRIPFSMLDKFGAPTPWPQVEGGVNEMFTKLGIGTKVVLAWISDGEKKESEIVLEQAPVHYRTAKRIRNRTLGLVAADLTFEVRAYLKLGEDAPGVVITKMQDGSPAAVAGLRPFEVITSVNGENVLSARNFAEMIRGKKDLTFSVRRLDATRIVRMQIKN